MSDNLIISISREYGSGGREIAEKLAAELGIAYYDKVLIARIAQECGFSDDVVENYDEKPIKRLLFNPNTFLTGMDGNMPVATEVHKKERSIIKEVAEESSCVIVGRCADSILADTPGLVTLFISAPLEDRIKRVMRRNDLDENDAKSRIAKVDRDRASYHNDFSSKSWGSANLYDLCIDSSRLSIEAAVTVITTYLNQLMNENKNITM